MAIQSADLMVYFSAQTAIELRKDALWPALTSQEYTSEWVDGAATVRIPKPIFAYTEGTKAGTISDPNDSTGVQVTDRARAGDWAALSGVDSSRILFTRSGGKASSQFMGSDDVLEVPWNVVEEYRSRGSYEMRDAIDSAILAAMWAYPANTTAFGDGSAGSGIDVDGNPLGSNNSAQNASNSLVFQAIEAWAELVEERDLQTQASDAVGSIYMVMHTRLWKALRRDMIQREFHWDTLTADLLRNNSVLAARGFRGRLMGIDIFTSNKAPLPAGSDKDTLWNILCGTRRAVVAATRPPQVQFFTPAQNQITDEPGYVLRQAADYGVQVLENDALMQTMTIDANAAD